MATGRVVTGDREQPRTVERRGITVHVNGEPTLWLEQPIAWRPQDVPDAWRALLWRDGA